MKKIIALACTLVMLVSMFTISANAAVDGATATLEFAGYEVKGTTTFAVVNVKVNIPETLVPYELIPADWETTFEDSYKGLMLQGLSVDIPNVAGLTYVSSLTTNKADFVTITDNKSASKLQFSYLATGNYDTYYAGGIDVLATVRYRITGDVAAEYALAASDVVVGLVDVQADGSVKTKQYTFGDFTVTDATVKEEAPEFEPETIEGTEVAATATEVELDKVPATAYKNVYTNVAVFNAELGADVKYGEAGFIWVKDGVKTANKFTVDASAITGGGTFNYGVVMVGIPDGVTISAIPYYVTAE